MKTSHLSLVSILLLSGAATAYSLGCETRVSVVEPPAAIDYACAPEDTGNSTPEALCPSIYDARLNRHGECRGWRTWTDNRTADHSGECLLAAVCKVSCEADSDCPAPTGGTTHPTCSTAGNDRFCMLGCDNGETCPTGLTCVAVDPSGLETPPVHQCVSVFHSEATYGPTQVANQGIGGGVMFCPSP